MTTTVDLAAALDSVALVRLGGADTPETTKLQRLVDRMQALASQVGETDRVRDFRVETDVFGRWVKLTFFFRQATYSISGQLLSPDRLLPDGEALEFQPRSVSSSRAREGNLPEERARDAWEAVKPLLVELVRRAAKSAGIPESEVLDPTTGV